MGGEPTFVSIDDMDGDEWNTLALGPEKRRLAGVLFRRLADRFATGPLLHFGQGKWYPGEQLPRWALTCHWRKDGEPIWRDPASLCAGIQADRRHARDGASLCAGLRATPAARSRLPVRRLRGHLVLPVARAAAAEQRHGRRRPRSATRWSASAWRGCSRRASTLPSATCCRFPAIMGASTTARPRTDMAAAGAAGRGSCARRSAT